MKKKKKTKVELNTILICQLIESCYMSPFLKGKDFGSGVVECNARHFGKVKR